METYTINKQDLKEFLKHLELMVNNFRLFNQSNMANQLEFYIKQFTKNIN